MHYATDRQFSLALDEIEKALDVGRAMRRTKIAQALIEQLNIAPMHSAPDDE
jgi:hypothetical protein